MPQPRSDASGPLLIQTEVGADLDAVAEGLQRGAVALGAGKQPRCPLRIDPLLHSDTRAHLDAGRAHGDSSIDSHRASEVPVNVDVRLHGFQLDAHVGGDRTYRALFADRESGSQDVPGAGNIANPASRRVQS